MDCGIGAQASLRDSRPFGVQPSVETLGCSRLSLRDTKTAVFPRRQNSPGVQQYDLWVMTSSPRERAGVRGTVMLAQGVAYAPLPRPAHRSKGRRALSHLSFRASKFAGDRRRFSVGRVVLDNPPAG